MEDSNKPYLVVPPRGRSNLYRVCTAYHGEFCRTTVKGNAYLIAKLLTDHYNEVG